MMKSHILSSFISIFCLSSFAILSSCQECSTIKEVGLETSFFPKDSFQVFTKIVADGANRDVSLVLKPSENQLDEPSIHLPVNSNKDVSRYYFYSSKGIDTVEITYKREFEYNCNKCGYRLNFENPEVTKNTISRRASIRLGIYSFILSSGFESKIEFYF